MSSMLTHLDGSLSSVRLLTLSQNWPSFSSLIFVDDLQLYVRGAVNYYIPGITYGEARELDGWLRRRVRLYYWKQWGRPRTRRRKLISLGISRTEVHKASRSRKGPWRMSNTSLVRMALNNQWLASQGVPSIAGQWISIRYPDGPKGQKEKP